MGGPEHENLFSIFGSRGLDDPSRCAQELFDCIRNPSVNIVVYHTPFVLEHHTLVETEVGGFGRFSYLQTGERVYIRVRSYFGPSHVKGRALIPMCDGETREISVLVTPIERPLSEGTLKILVATMHVHETPAYRYKPPVCAVAPSQASYGASVAPFILLNNFAAKQKRLVSLCGYEAIWSGSTTIIKTWDNIRNCSIKTSVGRGIANCYLAEWIASVHKRTKVDLAVIFECSEDTLRSVLSKCTNKIHKTLTQRLDHPDAAEIAVDPCVNDFQESIQMANTFLEQGTLGAFVDLIARGTFSGVKVSVFNAPTRFPLYLTACVLLSAFPEMARLPHTGEHHRDDKAASNLLIGMFRSVTTGIDHTSGSRTTAIEAILAVACDGLASFCANKTSEPTPSGKLKSVYTQTTRTQEIEEAQHIPYALEHMRRQGAALTQELFGKFPSELQNWISNQGEEFLGREAYNSALGVVFDRVSVLNVCERRRVSGATGTTSMATSLTMRHSTRESMQRVVIEMMLEVNTFVTDGTFRGARRTPTNSPADEATHGAMSGLRRNAFACRTAHADLIKYFTAGVTALITDGIPRILCIRPTTFVKCGDCGDDFDPLWTLPRESLSMCAQCSILFCQCCYLDRIKLIKTVYNDNNTITPEALAENQHILLCRRCGGGGCGDKH